MDSKLIIFLLLVVFSASQDLSDALTCLKDYIGTFQSEMDEQLFRMFSASYPNTLSTTVKHYDLTPGKERTYIITGDIEAMWLRDSTNQFLPYMKITKNCPKIKELALGLLNTQAELIMLDPYTNAFKQHEDPKRNREHYLNDVTQTLVLGIPVDLSRKREFATKTIWERKFEIDSLASFLRLAYEYCRRYDTIDHVNLNFIKALKRILKTLDEQSMDANYEGQLGINYYTFNRNPNQLRNSKIKPSFATGMIKTGFRPSDDPNDLAYNIPGNAMLSTYLDFVANKVLNKISVNSVFRFETEILRAKMSDYSKSIRQAIFSFGVVNHQGKKIFAYEVNGKAEYKAFDDANLPSLLSLPYLEFIKETDPLYLSTRAHILSKANPYFFEAGSIKGIGSSHTPNNSIWPLALITQALTSPDRNQIKNCLQSLKAHSGDNLIHQSFNVGSPKSITRSWFAWANSLFGEMIITLSQRFPDVLK